MQDIKIHKILCHGTLEDASFHTKKFFADTMLLNYDNLEIVVKESNNADDSQFWQNVDSAIEQNKELGRGYLRELEEMDCHRVVDLGELSSGYPSKVLHLLAHLMDGFIGIDSVFYNLPEDSHWLSDDLRSKIITHPDLYWLLHVRAVFHSLDSALVHK